MPAPQPHREADWLSCAQVAAKLGLPLRTAQWRVAKWAREGWVRVERRPVPGDRKWRLLVSRASLEAFLAGEPAEPEGRAA